MDKSLQSIGCILQCSRKRQQPVKKKEYGKKNGYFLLTNEFATYLQALFYTYDTKPLHSFERTLNFYFRDFCFPILKFI